jgi:hypothetical protein
VLVPMAMASASSWVALTKSAACSGSVSSIEWSSLPSAPMPSSSPASPVSSEPRQPSSPSTVTPSAWAICTTLRVTSTLYS